MGGACLPVALNLCRGDTSPRPRIARFVAVNVPDHPDADTDADADADADELFSLDETGSKGYEDQLDQKERPV